MGLHYSTTLNSHYSRADLVQRSRVNQPVWGNFPGRRGVENVRPKRAQNRRRRRHVHHLPGPQKGRRDEGAIIGKESARSRAEAAASELSNSLRCAAGDARIRFFYRPRRNKGVTCGRGMRTGSTSSNNDNDRRGIRQVTEIVPRGAEDPGDLLLTLGDLHAP